MYDKLQLLAKLNNLKLQIEATIRLLESDKEIQKNSLKNILDKYLELTETIWNSAIDQ